MNESISLNGGCPVNQSKTCLTKVNWVLMALLVLGSHAAALDDTRQRFSSVFKIGYFSLEADDLLDTYGERRPLFGDAYEGNRIDLEWHYAILTDVTLVFKANHLDHQLFLDDEDYSADAVGDVYIGLRQNLSPVGAMHQFASEIGFWSPSGYSDEAQPPIGSGGIDWQTVVSYGQTSPEGRGGFEMDFGYRFRNEFPDDEFLFDTRAFVMWKKWAKFTAGYHVTESKHDNLIAYDVLTYPQERGAQDVSFEIDFDLTRRWSVNLCYRDMLQGRNQIKASSYGIRLVWRQ